MSFNVRLFGYAGIIQVHERMVKQYNSDSVFLNEEPCLWSQIINCTNIAASSTVVALTPDTTKLVCVEVPDAAQIRYEVQPRGPTGTGARVAGNASRRASGFFMLQWDPGYTLSVIDAAGLL